jgi:hypothetical protein
VGTIHLDPTFETGRKEHLIVLASGREPHHPLGGRVAASLVSYGDIG